jgi:hypothetical protein
MPSPSPFARLRRLTSRERRVLVAGAVISALIVLATTVVAPAARRWQDREAAIAAKAGQVARLEALVAGRDAVAASATALREARDRTGRRLLDGSTVALAGSSLQSLVRSYGERSRSSIQRVDPARAPGPTGGGRAGDDSEAMDDEGLRPVALSVNAMGDIHGLVDLLYYLQSGEKLLVVDELRVSAGSGVRSGAALVWTLRVRGFFDPVEDGA